jgi:CO dehydrogenase/acetyl-CoA synthase gamma subunit (corrinoid Fe-S protein)
LKSVIRMRTLRSGHHQLCLTYFIVSGEVEASKVSDLAADQGLGRDLSVLTAWAAGKFSGDDVGLFVKKCGIMDKVKHTELIIPGYAASIAGDVEEELPGLDHHRRATRSSSPAGFLKARNNSVPRSSGLIVGRTQRLRYLLKTDKGEKYDSFR